MTLARRDPTNPIDRKFRRDRELRGEQPDKEDAVSREAESTPGFFWDYIVEPIIEGIGLLGLAIILAVVAGAIYVWVSIFLLNSSPF